MANKALRQLISTQADQLISETYTETHITQRLLDWQAHNPGADATLLASYQLAESRNFSEELLGRVLEQLSDQGYLNQPKA
ncbi:hypothetical protein [Lacticaseibacillus manihotivorans]|jgi:DNA-binding IscR family transcriptional regulator|uniref:Uncharacterized protein n=2 Tax=Lacticaseibacillus manihotivorans TaxID=88233 RepID=A0A0R1PZF0_9LACO|nr:hypothetical protein [Lacticaseibacillus manihotivorans]KRL37809.1 hypothetical protein FD01_GL002766 [Lacticaseibacillus manihotivorans DSM 13343 = JCM 12514]